MSEFENESEYNIVSPDGIVELTHNDVPYHTNDITFHTKPNAGILTLNASPSVEMLKLCANGDIFVKGKLIENDKEVVSALREFLKTQGFINT